MKKIALLFYRLTRNFKFKNYPSIKNKILKILIQNNIKYDIYIHTFSMDNEHGAKLNNNEFLLLKPKKYIIDNQNKIDKLLDFEKYKSLFKKLYPDNTIKNIARANYSKRQVWKLLENSNINYDVLIALRPDVEYLNEISLKHLEIQDNEIKLPNFSPEIYPLYFINIFSNQKKLNYKKSKQRSVNDRFAIGNFSTIKSYLNIGKYLLKLEPDNIGETEENLKSYLDLKKIKITIIFNFYFRRVRSNGEYATNSYCVWFPRIFNYEIRLFLFVFYLFFIYNILNLIY